jgi:mannose-6-phosphate isomerase
MRSLYPLLLKPEFHTRPWGARDLAPIYDRHVDPAEQPIGEAWLTGDDCIIANGEFTGRKLGDLCRDFGGTLVGSAAPNKERFPLLIKFLFPREKLSVQVHPDDEGAKRLNQPCGKTECWYVLDAQRNASVALGLKPGTTKDAFEQAIRENRAEDLLNWIPVQPGELIYVDAGTVHAIGPGSVLVETQQNSDTTFRLYDYGRPRELHIEQGMQALKERTNAGKVWRTSNADHDRLVASPCFVVDRVALSREQTFTGTPESAQCIVATQGGAVIEAENTSPVMLTCGECVVIPASVREYRIRPQWNIEFLRSALPVGEVGQPSIMLMAASLIGSR